MKLWVFGSFIFYFSDPKYALCLLCNKKLEKGVELTATMKTPNLKHHLKTVHPETFSKLEKTSKLTKSFRTLKSARGERSLNLYQYNWHAAKNNFCILYFREAFAKVSWSITMFSSLLLNPGTYKKYSKYKLSDKQGSQSSEEELTCRCCEAALQDKTWGIFWNRIKPICEQIKLQSFPDTRYVVKNEFSYCTSCYEQLFSETCQACDTLISAGEKVIDISHPYGYL